MTTEMIDGDLITSLGLEQLFNKPSPRIYARPRPDQKVKTVEALIDSAARHINELRYVDPDERLDYVQSANPALTEDHLQQIVSATDRWLDNEARNRMRDIARKFVKENNSPDDILPEWLSGQELARLQQLLTQMKFPDPVLATCYALCEADGVAHAAYFIRQNRALHTKDFADIKQSQAEVENDLRFVNAE